MNVAHSKPASQKFQAILQKNLYNSKGESATSTMTDQHTSISALPVSMGVKSLSDQECNPNNDGKRKRATDESEEEALKRNCHGVPSEWVFTNIAGDLFLTTVSYSDFLYSGFVVLEVGLDKVQFGIPGPLLKRKSSYFRDVLERQKNTNDEQPTTIRLPDESPKIVGGFIDWVYRERFKSRDDSVSRISERDYEYYLCQLYIFADHFVVPSMKTGILHRLHWSFIHWVPKSRFAEITEEEVADRILPVKAITYLWKNLPDSDPARKLIINGLRFFFFSHGQGWEAEFKRLSALPSDLLASVFVFIGNHPNILRPFGGSLQPKNDCDFLGHESCGLKP